MTAAALILALTILLGLTAMQIVLLARVPIGLYAWGGKEPILPARLRIPAGIAILLYFGFGALLASRTGILPAGGLPVVVITTWILFAYAAISILANLASKSSRERSVQTPVSIALTLAILVIAIGT